MSDKSYDIIDVAKKCVQLCGPVWKAGGAPTAAFDAESGEVLRAFDRSSPDERDFLASFGNAIRLPEADHTSLVLLSFVVRDGTRVLQHAYIRDLPDPGKPTSTPDRERLRTR